MPKKTLTTNTNTDAINWYGGDGTLAASGTFSSGSLKLQVSIDNGTTWFDANDADGNALAITADGALSFSVAPCKLRALMSGATAAAGTAQTETLTLVGPTAVAALVNVSFLANPALGDTITVRNGTSRTYTFAATSGTNNIVLGANLSATLTAIAAKLVADGYPTVASLGTTLTFTAATAGTAGNANTVQLVGASPFFSGTGDYNYSGGKDAGVLSASGNITLSITSALAGTFTLSVPVLQGDTLAIWTQRVANSLQNDNRISQFYNVTNNGSVVTLTKLSPFTANDSTLLVTAANGTPSPSLPATYSSANGTSGVATTPSITVLIEER
jgi:hypothetical protein